ncbi:alpha/beta hydrolase [Rhodanobacter glycinis]|uniref:Alpha/beta hydrolase n=1 Tax=Rhodanobacter glycinis TaxID=582702 RepID=A0A502C8U6_9GAMM|nr:alpha/beta hydrolase [Rhodanobacter glycinis]TPG08156.1 alpha/beta hydrolase [Rhodanobacter glycinis]
MTSLFHKLLGRAVLAAGIVASSAAMATGHAGPAASALPTPTTAVLVHGAWADGSSWAGVTPLLQRHGLKVVSVQLQRASLGEDAAIVRRAVEAQAGPVILVGHSYGGVVITEAGTSAKVVDLVYVDAFAPGDNESIDDLTKPYPAGAWQAGIIKDDAGYLTLRSSVYLANFAPDVPAGEARVMATSQGPIFAHVLDDKVSHAAWKSKPSYFVVGSADQIIPPAFQLGEAKRIGAQVTMIPDASHVSMVSHPTAVANVILRAAARVNGI